MLLRLHHLEQFNLPKQPHKFETALDYHTLPSTSFRQTPSAAAAVANQAGASRHVRRGDTAFPSHQGLVASPRAAVLVG